MERPSSRVHQAAFPLNGTVQMAVVGLWFANRATPHRRKDETRSVLDLAHGVQHDRHTSVVCIACFAAPAGRFDRRGPRHSQRPDYDGDAPTPRKSTRREPRKLLSWCTAAPSSAHRILWRTQPQLWVRTQRSEAASSANAACGRRLSRPSASRVLTRSNVRPKTLRPFAFF